MDKEQAGKIIEELKLLNEQNQLALSQVGFFGPLGLIALYIIAIALITVLVHFW